MLTLPSSHLSTLPKASKFLLGLMIYITTLSGTQLAQAREFPLPDRGKLLATGGVSQVEGAGGGGLTPWALITGYGTRDSYGGNLHMTQLATQDYALRTYGLAMGFADRFEVSLAKQEFTGSKAPLNQLKLKQDILGVKLKIAGDALYEQDSWLPQLAIGAQWKRSGSVGGLSALGVTNVTQLGAKNDSGTDYYLSATKIFLEHSLLLNGTLRATKANQMGLLGFGGEKNNSYQAQLEVSAAYLLNRKTVIGAEYRMKPHNLNLDNEKAYYDIFIAWFPNKHVSLTAAYVVLGDITILNPQRQRGPYLSLQVGF